MNPLFYALGAVAAIELAMGVRLLFKATFGTNKWWQTTLAFIIGGLLIALGLENIVLFITKGVLA